MSALAFGPVALLLVLLLPVFISVAALALVRREKGRKKKERYDYRERLVGEMDLYAQLWFYHSRGRRKEMARLLKKQLNDRGFVGYYASRLLEELRRTR